MEKTRIALFASGKGSNAEKIIQYFKYHKTIEVSTVFSNNASAGVINIAHNEAVAVRVFSNLEIENGEKLVHELTALSINVIVLAGFLRKIPACLINTFPNLIINLHPALLPKFGGKGMYGKHVHAAVKNARETQTGITIHLVNEKYDEGNYLAQFFTPISPSDSAEIIEQKVQRLEHLYFPVVIEKYILSLKD